MWHPAPPLELSFEQRAFLEEVAQSPSRPYREVVRAKALLAAGEGVANIEIARRCDTSAVTVRAWRLRFAEQGIKDFGKVAPGRGRKAAYSNDDYISMVELLFNTTPDNGDARWSVWSMAAACGE